MPERAPDFVTVLMRLPLFYSPDARGERRPVEDERRYLTPWHEKRS